jgi:UDP-xylose:glucoside alpha-1,3-xylosyltransferase
VFHELTSKQLFVAAQELEVITSWFNNQNSHPFVAPHGLNSGVLLMNLTRMRDFLFVEKIVKIYEQYENQIHWTDQDLLNIIGYYNPGLLFHRLYIQVYHL